MGFNRPGTANLISEYDAVSGSGYIGKRTAVANPLRQMSAQSRTIKLTPNAKTFYPDGYFKRVSYEKSDTASTHARARVDALGQRVRDRFNEDTTGDVIR